MRTPPGVAAAAWTKAELCPGCCTLADIPEFEPSREVLTPLVECTRCGFRFPILPGDYKQLTLDSMCHHDCTGQQVGDWEALGLAIVNGILEHAITGADLAERLDALWPGDSPDTGGPQPS
jgi:hypothetical protein